jgi:hypothetical protein
MPIIREGEWDKESDDYDLECGRCHNSSDRLYRHIKSKYDNIYGGGDEIPKEDQEDIWVCWDCDFEVINGGEMNEEASEILQARAEENYEHDPLWYPKPPGWK